MNSIEMSSLRVLIIDDEAFMLKLIVRLLKNLEIENVATASNGKEALIHIAKTKAEFGLKYDLIICDLEMPVCDGFQFLEHLRMDEHIGHQEVPVLVLTGNSQEDHVRQAAEHGIHGFLVKPVSQKALEERLRTALMSPPVALKALKGEGSDE